MARIIITKCPDCGLEREVEYDREPSENPAHNDIFENWARNMICGECQAKGEDEERLKKEAAAQRLTDLRVREAGFPKGLVDYDPAKGNKKLLAWMRTHWAGSLYISGGYGLGKTWAVCHAGRAMCKTGKKVLFYPCVDLLRRVVFTLTAGGLELLDEAQNCDLLILDDLGKEKTNEKAAEALFSIVDARYRDGLPMWITSNYKLSTLEDRMGDVGEAIARRLREMCVNYEPNKEVAK